MSSEDLKLKMCKQPKLVLEFMDFLCGDLIGRGLYRNVFEYALDSDYVIKVEFENMGGCNWSEWNTWWVVKETSHAKWFAPCEWISHGGSLLVQRKAELIESSDKKVPNNIPHYFTDLKPDNFGWIDNQFVCVDYASVADMSVSYSLNKKVKTTKNYLR